MSNPKIKKAVKLLAQLIIISVLFLPICTFSQVDTAKLRKEINTILKKYGLSEAAFQLKVSSTNQKGGQTAFVINNYYVGGIVQRRLTSKLLSDIISKIPSLDTPIILLYSGGKEGVNFTEEIGTALMKKGYKNIKGSNWMDPNDFDKIDYKMENGTFVIKIYPASNVQ
jgi:hypothetical protein